MAARSEDENELLPGHKILYKEDYTFSIFSGKIGSCGFTVAHIAKGKSNELHDAIGKNVIAKIVKKIGGTIKTGDDEFTADIAFLKMNRSCRVKNILCCTNGQTLREHRLVLYKGEISEGEPVMVVDENGFVKQGTIKSTKYNWKAAGTENEVINALRIVDENNCAIAQHGQSGSLVTSRPQLGSDVLWVYGIVTHILENGNRSATIANRLWNVFSVYHNIGQHPSIRLGDSLDSIDFADD